MSQRSLIAVFTSALVAVLGLSVLINWGVTTAVINSATVAGPAGPVGPSGADGKDGIDGKNGVDGKDGTPGSNGHGATGQRGPTGPTGPAGSPGPTGAPGPSGAPGADATPTPPYELSTGAGSLTVPQYPAITSLTGSGLTVPAGVYAVTIDVSALAGETVSGDPSGGECRMSVDGTGTSNYFYFTVGFAAEDTALASVQSLTSSSVIELQCFAFVGFDLPTVDQLTWTDITITATRLD